MELPRFFLHFKPQFQSQHHMNRTLLVRFKICTTLFTSLVMNTLAKLWRHIYVFRNRRLWKDALQKQTMVAGLKVQKLSLDMPVCWNSTYKMLETATKLRVPITAICALQQWDINIRDIALNANDRSTIKELELFFAILLSPLQKL